MIPLYIRMERTSIHAYIASTEPRRSLDHCSMYIKLALIPLHVGIVFVEDPTDDWEPTATLLCALLMKQQWPYFRPLPSRLGNPSHALPPSLPPLPPPAARSRDPDLVLFSPPSQDDEFAGLGGSAVGVEKAMPLPVVDPFLVDTASLATRSSKAGAGSRADAGIVPQVLVQFCVS